MANLTRAQLKLRFEAGDIPAESDYWNLIDSLAHTGDVLETVPTSTPVAGSILGGVAGYALKTSIDDLTANTPTKTEFDALPQTYYNKTESDDRYIQSTSANADVAFIPGLLNGQNDLYEKVFGPRTDGLPALEARVDNHETILSFINNLQIPDIATAFTADTLAKTMVLDPTWTLAFEGGTLSSHISHLATQSALLDVQSDFNVALATKASTSHSHSAYATTESLDANYSSLLGMISAKAPLSHTHSESEITGLDSKFTTPAQVQNLIDASAQTLNQTTLLDDFYEKPEVDEAIRIALGEANSEHPVADYGLVDPDAPGYIRNKPTLFSGSYNDLTDIPAQSPWDAERNIQADWSETDMTSDSYIRNKPALSGGSPSATTPDEDLLYALSVIWQQLTGELTEGSQVVAAITGSSIYASDGYFDDVYARGLTVTPYVQWQ